MKYLLHIDTATDTGTVAISGDGLLIAARTNSESRQHASTINLMINEVLAEAELQLATIDAVVVCAGPGSYTGLRIGMATAKGICYALDKPLLLDNRLTLLAYQAYIKQANPQSSYISLLVAREKEYFIAIYDEQFNCTLVSKHITEEELMKYMPVSESIYIITDASPDSFKQTEISTLNIISDTNIDLKTWLLYAFDQYNCNNSVNLSTAEPFYLKQVYTHK